MNTLPVIFFLFVTSFFCQEWASMAYTVNHNDPKSFRGFFKSESKEDIIFGKYCVDNQCVYEMTPSEYISDMEQLGWEVSEEVHAKDKKGLNVIWFRRYQ